MLLSGFLILFFGFFVLFGYLGLRSHRRLQRIGVKTMATTVGVEKQESYDSQGKSISYHLKLEFRASNGDNYTVKTNSNKRKKGALRMEQEKAQFPSFMTLQTPPNSQ